MLRQYGDYLSRVPFLDKNVFEVASQLPSHLKIHENTTKYILRQAAKGIVPPMF
jgi:asparagine synthase (glutamine-hydrolysing)